MNKIKEFKNKQSVTEMNRSHIELVQTLVSGKISPATEKNLVLGVVVSSSGYMTYNKY